MITENSIAEEAVIGSIIQEGDLIQETRLKAKSFGPLRHQIIFQAMLNIVEKQIPVDLISLVTELGNKITEIGGIEYLSKLADTVPSTATFKHYEDLVVQEAKTRAAIQIFNEFLSNPYHDEIPEIINKITELEERSQRKQYRTKKDILRDVADHMHTAHGELTGVTSGLTELDRMTGGWQNQDLIIVAARPSVGKTAFALELSKANSKNGGVSTIFSLEMSDKQMMFRILSSIGSIDGQKWRNPDKLFSATDYDRAIYAIGEVDKVDLEIIDDSGMTVNLIRSKAREIKKRFPGRKHLFVVDYLQLIHSANGKRSENRQQEVSEISRSLKGLARELDAPVIALSQLSRGVESRQDKRPLMSDIRESGSIEQDADVVAFLYRDDYYDKESEKKDIIEIIIAKQRNGPIGTVETAFVKEYGKFVNLERRLVQGG